MYRPMWSFLLMYGSYDMRRTGFPKLTVVNGTPRVRGVTIRMSDGQVMAKTRSWGLRGHLDSTSLGHTHTHTHALR